MANNPVLGQKVHEHLQRLGIETPMAPGMRSDTFDVIRTSYATIMTALGLDLTNDSLFETPKRVAKMYTQEIYQGLDYNNFPACTAVENKMHYDEMICVNGITVQSMCEHHAMPFIGTASVAYIPGEKVLGLSKFNRIVDFFARRPQIQERLTEQVSAALRYILGTEDVAVVIRAEHFCVRLRGVQDACSDTVTSKLTGKFRDVPELRAEFLALSRG